jgi:hypothetical protein
VTKRIALAAFFAAHVAIAITFAGALLGGEAPRWAPWLFMLAIATALIAIMIVGASSATRDGRAGIGRLWIPFGCAFLILAVGFGLALALPAETADSPLLFGLPLRAAIIMYGVGLLPAFIVPVAYAVTFERHTLSREDLERVRAMRAVNEARAA